MKITKYFLSLAAAIGMFAACQKQEIVQISAPENVKAPALAAVETIEISKDNLNTGSADFSWSKADFGAPTQVNYSLEIAASGSETKYTLTSGLTETTTSVTYQTLNTFLLTEMNLPANVLSEVQFYVGAKVGEYAKVYSAPLTVSVGTVEAIIPEKDMYKYVYVIGDYCGWSHDKTQFLYNYDTDNNNLYSGVVDFADKAANGFKLTGGPDWNHGNWGTLDGAVLDSEQAEVQLRDDGGSGDIKAYSKRFYHFEFDSSTLILKKKLGFDQLGVIGDFNSWGGDVVMEYNPTLVRFYADVEVPADGGLKVRVDADWATSWGENMESGNLPVAAGNYRVYLDLNKGSLTVDANMYGQPEPGLPGDEPESEPEPEPAYKGWGIIGVGGNWEVDVPMTEDNGVWTAYATLAEGDNFKFRKDAAWDENFGGVFTALDTPFEAVAGGENITGIPAGFYKFVLNTNDKTITISAGEVWGLIGAISGSNWDKDFFMTETAENVWTSAEIELTEESEFKIRKNASWDVNRGGTFTAVGEAFDAVDGGDNISGVPAGKYTVTYDAANEKITISDAAKYWSIIGAVNGSNWDLDAEMKEAMPGVWISQPVALTGEWKIRYGKDWGVNRGGAVLEAAGQFSEAVHNGANITYTSESCIVVYNANTETIGTLVWGLVGSIASIDGFNWNADVPMNLGKDGKWYSIPVALTTADEFKLRYMAAWDDNRGGTLTAAEEAFEVTNGGSNIKVAEDGTYMVVYDPATETITLTKAFWGLIGDFNSWGTDVFMMYDGDGNWVAYNKALAGGWKIRKGADWAVSVGGTYTAGEAFEAVSENGPNIVVEGLESFDIIYDTTAGTILVQ